MLTSFVVLGASVALPAPAAWSRVDALVVSDLHFDASVVSVVGTAVVPTGLHVSLDQSLGGCGDAPGPWGGAVKVVLAREGDPSGREAVALLPDGGAAQVSGTWHGSWQVAAAHAGRWTAVAVSACGQSAVDPRPDHAAAITVTVSAPPRLAVQTADVVAGSTRVLHVALRSSGGSLLSGYSLAWNVGPVPCLPLEVWASACDPDPWRQPGVVALPGGATRLTSRADTVWLSAFRPDGSGALVTVARRRVPARFVFTYLRATPRPATMTRGSSFTFAVGVRGAGPAGRRVLLERAVGRRWRVVASSPGSRLTLHPTLRGRLLYRVRVVDAWLMRQDGLSRVDYGPYTVVPRATAPFAVLVR